MFWDDIVLVSELVGKYGLRRAFGDLGGQDRPTIADYELTIKTGDQNARYVHLEQRPFDHIDREYFVINPEKGHPYIEDLPKHLSGQFGTLVCLNVLEHVENPFVVFAAMKQLMKPDAMLIVETPFSFPYHCEPRDFWRFSPESLRYLGVTTGLTVLEAGWRLNIPGTAGVLNGQDGTPQEIKSVYAAYSNGPLSQMAPVKYPLPRRRSANPAANLILDQQVT